MASDPPELPTNDQWRAGMVRARKARGLSQEQLGSLVGTSQNIISLIESGGIGGSGYVLAICKVLKIAPPGFFESEDDETWFQLGHLLRLKNPKQFRRAMDLVESMLEEVGESDGVSPNGDRPSARK